MKYALHIGLKSDITEHEVIAPTLLIGNDHVPFDLSFLINDEDGRMSGDKLIDLGMLDCETFIVQGSWQVWSEPQEDDILDFHLLVNSTRPWTKDGIDNVLTSVYRRLTFGRVFDYCLTDMTESWGERETVWLNDGVTLYEVKSS